MQYLEYKKNAAKKAKPTSDPTPKNPPRNVRSQPNNRNNGNNNSPSSNTRSNDKPRANDSTRSNNTSGNRSQNSANTRKSSSCGFCGKEHNYKECEAKYPFYKASVVKLLLSIDRTPTARKDWPKDGHFLTRDTNWIKDLIEKKNQSRNTSTTSQANVQAVDVQNPSQPKKNPRQSNGGKGSDTASQPSKK